MTDLPERRYDENEVSKLLKRAADLQRSSPVAANPTGLTLAELESIAREAGLDPDMVRQAAHELATTSPAIELGQRLIGAPLRIVIERQIPVEADPTTFLNLLATIETGFGGPGQVSKLGGTLTWMCTRPGSGRTQQVRVSVANGKTNIHIEENYRSLVGGLFGGVIGGVGGGLGIGAGTSLGLALGSVAMAVGLPVLLIAGTYGIVRGGYRSFVTHRQNVLQRLMNELTDAFTHDS